MSAPSSAPAPQTPEPSAAPAFGRSLPARAALVVGGGAALFVAALTWSAGTMLQRQRERHLGGELETLAHQLSDKIDRAIYERTREVQFVTNLTPFRDPGVPAIERRRVLEAVLDSSQDFAWLGFANAEGKI